MRKKFKLYSFSVLVFLLIIGTLDYLFGFFFETNKIKNDSFLFRNQADKLKINTRFLKPNIKDKYTLNSNEFETSDKGFLKNQKKNLNVKKKVLFLGGSTTENNEVSFDKRFHLLLNNYFSDIDFYNGGVRGNTSLDSINLLINHKSYKRGYDYYVLMHNINDRYFLNEFPDYQFYKIKKNFSDISIDELKNNFFDKLTYFSNIIFYIRYKFFNFYPWADHIDQFYKRQENKIEQDLKDQDTFKENLITFVSIVRSRNSIPVLMTQPLGYKDDKHELYNDIIRKVANENNIIIIDLAKRLSDKKFFLGDGVHFNDIGSIEAAKIIEDSFKKKQISKKKKFFNYNLASEIKKNCGSNDSKYKIFDTPYYGRYPSLSPDLQKMAYQDFQNNLSFVKIVNLKNNVNQIIKDSKLNIRHPFFLDKDTLIYSKGNSKEESIYLFKIEDNKEKKLINDSIFYSTSIAHYKNEIIFFAATTKDQNYITLPNIFSYNIKSKTLKKLTNNKHESWRPVYNSKTNTLFYISNPDGNFDIFSKNLKNLESKRINFSFYDEWDPFVDEEKNYLFFSSKKNGNWDIFFLDLNNNKIKQLTYTKEEDEWDTFVLPIFNVILFASNNKLYTNIKFLCY